MSVDFLCSISANNRSRLAGELQERIQVKPGLLWVSILLFHSHVSNDVLVWLVPMGGAHVKLVLVKNRRISILFCAKK